MVFAVVPRDVACSDQSISHPSTLDRDTVGIRCSPDLGKHLLLVQTSMWYGYFCLPSAGYLLPSPWKANVTSLPISQGFNEQKNSWSGPTQKALEQGNRKAWGKTGRNGKIFAAVKTRDKLISPLVIMWHNLTLACNHSALCFHHPPPLWVNPDGRDYSLIRVGICGPEMNTVPIPPTLQLAAEQRGMEGAQEAAASLSWTGWLLAFHTQCQCGPCTVCSLSCGKIAMTPPESHSTTLRLSEPRAWGGAGGVLGFSKSIWGG